MKRLAVEWFQRALTSEPIVFREHPSFPENTLQRKIGTIWICPVSFLGKEIEGFDRKVCPLLKWSRKEALFQSSKAYPKMEWKNIGAPITCRLAFFCRKGLWDYAYIVGRGMSISIGEKVGINLVGTKITWGVRE